MQKENTVTILFRLWRSGVLDLSKIVGTFALFTNVFGNVLGFVPYGFILPVITGKCEMAFFSYYPAFYQSDDRSDPAAYKSWLALMG